MRKIYCFFLLITLPMLLHAQQRPQYSQYIYNNYLLNPALSGIESYTDVKAGYRTQWTGLDGAPTTSFLSVSMPIGNSYVEGDAVSFNSKEDQNPFSRSNLLNYRASAPHHGVGLMIVSDKTGAISETNINATYAYHIGITSRVNLSAGVSAGAAHHQINTSMLTLKDQNDAAIANIEPNQWKPDLGIGVWVYSADYFIGASAQQLFPQRLYTIEDNGSLNSSTVPHYFISGGVKVFLSEDISILPSALIKFVKPVPVSFDLNAKLSFSDKFWLGASYRRNDSITGMAGFNLNSFINLSYAYDVGNKQFNTRNNGSHEIVIGLLLNNRFKLNCPEHGF